MARSSSFSQIWRSRGVVLRLAHAQLRDRYSASALGMLWALLQPAMTMAVFWFVFVFGLKITSPLDEAPFVALLLVGLAPWFYFNDAVGGSANAVTSSAYLVRKIAFPLEILPLAPLAASLVVHVALLALLAAGLIVAGEWAGWRVLLLPIFVASLCVLAAGLAFWLAAFNVFHRDVAQTAVLLLQIWFWMTPIVWSFSAFPSDVVAVLKWNPLVFIIEGYRYCLLAKVTVPPSLASAANFWVVSVFVLVSGVFIYRKLQPEFADIL